MSNDATFNQHINNKCSSIKLLIAWALRTFTSRRPSVMLTLWMTLIRCHIEYCSQLWSPHKTGALQSIELLQKSFLNRIDGLYSLDYWEQLSHLKLYSLERRRERYRIIYTWRVIEGQVPNFDSTPITSRHTSKRLGRMCVVPPVTSPTGNAITSIREASLPIMGPQLFNVLPLELRNLTECSVEDFKTELDQFLASIPDQPLLPGLTQFRRIDSNSIIDWVHSPYLPVQTVQPKPSLRRRCAAEAVTRR